MKEKEQKKEEEKRTKTPKKNMEYFQILIKRGIFYILAYVPQTSFIRSKIHGSDY